MKQKTLYPKTYAKIVKLILHKNYPFEGLTSKQLKEELQPSPIRRYDGTTLVYEVKMHTPWKPENRHGRWEIIAEDEQGNLYSLEWGALYGKKKKGWLNVGTPIKIFDHPKSYRKRFSLVGR